jgi:tyrosine-protein phosphatase YwqE
MSLFSIFKRKKKEPAYPPVSDFSQVLCDIHSHLIPGIDDGVKDMHESIEMIKQFIDLGYKKLVTTPHVMSDYFKNKPETILSGIRDVREVAAREGLDIKLEAAAEYYVDENFLTKLKNEKILAINDKYLLFELSYINPPDNIGSVIFEINVQNFVPLLAHPERYNYWYERYDEYFKLKESGALFQINVNSLTGYYGKAALRTAHFLIDEKLVDFIGSDLHGQRHMDGLKRVVNEKYFWKLMAQGVKNRELLSIED